MKLRQNESVRHWQEITRKEVEGLIRNMNDWHLATFAPSVRLSKNVYAKITTSKSLCTWTQKPKKKRNREEVEREIETLRRKLGNIGPLIWKR